MNKEKTQKNFCSNTQALISSAWKKGDGEDFGEKEGTANENLAKRDIELHSMNSVMQMAAHQGKWLD